MLHDIYQHLSLAINPIAFSIGSFAIRWYALSYIVGFLVVYLVLMWRIRHDDFKKTAQIFNLQFSIYNEILNSQISNEIQKSKFQNLASNLVIDYLLLAFFSAIVGGRLGYVLFYNLQYFLVHPWAIVSPFNQQGSLVGLYGMSYHGALLGIVMASWVFLKKRNINFLAWADFIVPAAAAGYFFGRIGNFLNGELYGRITDSPLGMYFAGDPTFLRHPSQLYEALLEGALLFAILWKMREKKLAQGALFGIYLLGYGLLRTAVEQFREPDYQLGLIWSYFTMGQILSLAMIAGGAYLLFPKKYK